MATEDVRNVVFIAVSTPMAPLLGDIKELFDILCDGGFFIGFWRNKENKYWIEEIKNVFFEVVWEKTKTIVIFFLKWVCVSELQVYLLFWQKKVN